VAHSAFVPLEFCPFGVLFRLEVRCWVYEIAGKVISFPVPPWFFCVAASRSSIAANRFGDPKNRESLQMIYEWKSGWDMITRLADNHQELNADLVHVLHIKISVIRDEALPPDFVMWADRSGKPQITEKTPNTNRFRQFLLIS
jgi:hypothetical protein